MPARDRALSAREPLNYNGSMKVVFIAGSSKKQFKAAKAKNLYDSPLFKLSWQYANKLKPDRIYILSAKYGLVDPSAMLNPYNATLNSMSTKEVRAWADKVIIQMEKEKINFFKDKAIFLAGSNYRKHITTLFKKYEVPMEGLGIGRQLKYLKDHV